MSPSSMTFGGDCQSIRRMPTEDIPPVPIPPLAYPSPEISIPLPPPVPSKRDSDDARPPPVPEKDFDFGPKSPKSPVSPTSTSGAGSTRTVRRRTSVSQDLTSRLSRASSSTSASRTPRNFTYPASITAETEPEDEIDGGADELGFLLGESRPGSYYYSAPTRSRSGSVSAGGRVEGWAERDRVLGRSSRSVTLVQEPLHEEVEAGAPGVGLGSVSDDDSALDLHTPLP